MLSFGMEAAEVPAFVVVELLVVTRQIVKILKSYQKAFGAYPTILHVKIFSSQSAAMCSKGPSARSWTRRDRCI